MNDNSEKLWKKFKNLGIEVGSVRTNVIGGWFDTNNKELPDFLNFISYYITRDNFLDPIEVEAYNQLKRDEILLIGREYEEACKNVSVESPGLFDYKQNCIDVDILQHRTLHIVKQKDYFNDETHKFKISYREVGNEVVRYERKELRSNVDLKSAGESCVDLALNLDELYIKIFQEFSCYEPLIPSLQIDIFYSEFLNQVKDTITQLNTCEMSRVYKFDDNLNLVKNRAITSAKLIKNKEILLEMLTAKKNFLTRLDIMSLILLSQNILSETVNIESNIISKEAVCNIYMLQLESKCSVDIIKTLNEDKLFMAQEKLAFIEEQLNFTPTVLKYINQFSSYYVIMYSLLNTNRSNINNFFEIRLAVYKSVQDYLQSCQLRIEGMESNIQEHQIYKNLPIEEKNPFVNVLIKFLSTDTNKMNLKSICDHIAQLKQQCLDIKRKIFCYEPESFKKQIEKLQLNINVIKNFLSNGPTSEFVSLPYDLCKLFKEVDGSHSSNNSSLRSAVAAVHKTKKLLSSDKWLKHKRLLWIYFLMEPKKLERVMDNIEKEVKNRRKEGLKK